MDKLSMSLDAIIARNKDEKPKKPSPKKNNNNDHRQSNRNFQSNFQKPHALKVSSRHDDHLVGKFYRDHNTKAVAQRQRKVETTELSKTIPANSNQVQSQVHQTSHLSVFERLGKSDKSGTVVIFRNLQMSVEQSDVYELCQAVGDVKEVQLCHEGDLVVARAIFRNERDAATCVVRYHGLTLDQLEMNVTLESPSPLVKSVFQRLEECSPASSGLGKTFSFGVLTGTGYQGVADPSRAYQRDELVDSVLAKLQNERFVIVQSPPACGKSALLQLIWYRYRANNVSYVRLIRNKDPFESLKCFGGIDLMVNQQEDEREMLIMIDDAQNAFSPELNVHFWNTFIKSLTLPKNARFIIALTYLIGGQESPVEFSNLPRITPEEMLLNSQQSCEFLINFLNFPFSNDSSLVEVIVEDCGGNIGALAIVHDRYKSKFRFEESPLSEVLIDYFISPQLTESMDRLFGSETLLSTEQQVVIDLLYGEVVTIHTAVLTDNIELKRYIKCGLLSRKDTGETKFTNAMSRRYFIHKTYPQTAVSNPSTPVELVINSIRKISATTLGHSVVGDGFPKEAVFQHLMMTGMTASLKATTHVYPENSVVVGTGDKIKGELDFFINGELRWGIELLIQGRKLKAYRERFIGEGKYVNLGCREYVVVDFRESPVGAPKDNYVAVYFKLNDYRSATCLLPNGTSCNIYLSP